MSELFIDNTGVVELNGLKNAVTDTFENDALVECTVYLRGTAVAGQTFPLTLDYVADSDGDYRGMLDAALDLDEDLTYTAVVEVTTTGGIQGKWTCSVQAKERPCAADC